MYSLYFHEHKVDDEGNHHVSLLDSPNYFYVIRPHRWKYMLTDMMEPSAYAHHTYYGDK